MQFIATILALAATAVAVPSSGSESSGCTFGQYECSYDGDSIKQCDISGSWVVSALTFLLSCPLHPSFSLSCPPLSSVFGIA